MDHNLNGPMLETRGLYKFYGKSPVISDISLSVPAGRFVTVMGPSGSGKSTLLHGVSGLEPPSGGSVTLAGQDLYALSERRRTLLRRDMVGFVFQFYNLIPNLNAEENIRLPIMIGASARDDGAFDRLVGFFQLEEKLRHYPHQLSGGEMQRVSIARALITQPSIVMADEPTGNISTRSGEEVMELFRKSCDEFGQTILLVTHNPRDAAYSDEVHFLKDGEMHNEVKLSDGQVTADGIGRSLQALGI